MPPDASIAEAADDPASGDLAVVGDGFRRSAGDLEVGEVRLLVRVAPEADGAIEAVSLEAVDDEAGIGRVVDVKARLPATHVDLNVCPLVGLEVGPGLINGGPLAAEFLPGEPGNRDVLDGVVAHALIVGVRVAGAQVEELIT